MERLSCIDSNISDLPRSETANNCTRARHHRGAIICISAGCVCFAVCRPFQACRRPKWCTISQPREGNIALHGEITHKCTNQGNSHEDISACLRVVDYTAPSNALLLATAPILPTLVRPGTFVRDPSLPAPTRGTVTRYLVGTSDALCSVQLLAQMSNVLHKLTLVMW